MTRSNIINDLSAATKVPNKVLTELTSKEILCIGSAITEAIAQKEDILVLNIGFGTLSIELATMQCKFVPSAELKSTIKHCVSGKKDPLEIKLEQTIIEKLLKTCDEVF